ncbi:molecular chaperone DjiA [Limibaculum sp. M0105]|uniref:Molecular chaperone DjiA n=1 Tax=Thermohalobaculum xanthum TaxID=2753746 RepID=A0A8J7SIN2_9RHOB|nr:molecular chaperone DjiA [Thermohalobaculum xanthum]MBK0400445.1 molecular chaperone DjiA [Thermohalobaculum xanthum]
MSIWSRIRESLAALARGEPLSRVFERLATPPERTVAFTIAVIALGAKMAKADGRVTRDEVAAFREIFSIPPEEEENAARIYNLARTDVAGFEVYAERIAAMFRDRPAVLADLLEGLVYIAIADGEYHPCEHAFLEEVARIFGVSEAQFRAMRARHLPGEIDPWSVLGIAPGADPVEVRARYRELVRELHPDQMVARGVPHEARRLAEQRLATVNDAYAQLRADRAG